MECGWVWDGYLILVIRVSFGYLKIFWIKEPLGLGIWKEVRLHELPVLGISKTSKKAFGFHESTVANGYEITYSCRLYNKN
jgi:hypothetical protein